MTGYGSASGKKIYQGQQEYPETGLVEQARVSCYTDQKANTN